MDGRPAIRRRRILTLFGTLVVVPLVILSSATNESLGTKSTANFNHLAYGPSAVVQRGTGDAQLAASVGSQEDIAPASAGSWLRTVFPNYNATLAGDLPWSVEGWQIGSPAYVPATQELWLPNRAVSFDSLPIPSISPAIVYDTRDNQTAGLVPSIQDTAAMLYDPENELLYTADFANDTVGVINPGTWQWVHQAIPVGVNPDALALDPVHGRLYVANSGSNNITIINCSTESVAVGGISTGADPHALAFDGVDGTLFIADGGDSYLRTIDTDTNTSGLSFALLGIPGGVAYSALAGAVAVTVPTRSQMVILDASVLSPEWLPNIGLGGGPIVTNSSGSAFVVGNTTGSNVDVVNSTTGVVASPEIDVGSNVTQLAQGQNSNWVYAWAAQSRNVSEISLEAMHSESSSPTLGPLPYSMAFDPQFGLLFVDEVQRDSISVLNVSTGLAVRPPLYFPSGALSVAVDPSTNALYVGMWNGVESIGLPGYTVTSTDESLVGGNSPLLVDLPDGLLWDANNDSGVVALQLSNLSVAHVVGIPAAFVTQDTMALDSESHLLFVLNKDTGEIEAVNTTTGSVVDSEVSAPPGATGIAFDSLDDRVYVVGENVTIINPTSLSAPPVSIAVAPHTTATGITFDPLRGYLYITTAQGSPSYQSAVSVLDGSSVAASESSLVTISAGELSSDPTPVSMLGTSSPADSMIWIANTQSGTLGVIASLPRITGFATSPTRIDVGQGAQLLTAYNGGTGPDTITYSGLPEGCESENSPVLNCTPTQSGNFTIGVVVTDALGYKAIANASLTVAPGLSVLVDFVRGSSHERDVGQNLSAVAIASGGTPAFAYDWSFGDGALATGSEVSHAYQRPGEYLLNVSVTDAADATVTDSAIIDVNPTPTASLAVTPGNLTDVGIPLSFSATITGGSSPGNSSWRFGDGTGASYGSAATHSWTVAGAYNVTFSYTDEVGVTVNQTLSVLVKPALAATFSVSGGAGSAPDTFGPNITFLAKIAGGLSPYNVTWSFDDGSYGFGAALEHLYAISGDYTVGVTVEDAAGSHLNSTLPIVIDIKAPSSSPSASNSVSTLGGELFLGVLVGAAGASVIMFLMGRSRERSRPPPPPSPYVPPASVETAPQWSEER